MTSLEVAAILTSAFLLSLILFYLKTIKKIVKLENQLKYNQLITERQEELLNECWLKFISLKPSIPGLGSLTFRLKRYKVDKSYKESYHELNDLVKDIRECYEGPGVPNEYYIRHRLKEYDKNQQS